MFRLSSLLVVIAMFASAQANASGANDRAVSEFRNLGVLIVKSLRKADLRYHGDDFEALLKIVKTANIEPTQEVLTRDFGGGKTKTVDAMNYPDQMKIVLYVPGWKRLKSHERRALVLHEFLGLQKVEKDSYEQSTWLLDGLKKIKDRSSPEGQCSSEAYGYHNGSACLWQFGEANDKKIAAAEKRLADLTAPVKGESSKRVAVRTAFEQLKSSREAVTTTKCDLATAAFSGNQAAYHRDLCETKASLDYLTKLRKLIRKLR